MKILINLEVMLYKTFLGYSRNHNTKKVIIFRCAIIKEYNKIIQKPLVLENF